MMSDSEHGRDPLGQALAVPVEPVARLDPSGFDPSRGAFTEHYIDDAATARYSAYRADGSLFCDQVSNYDPPDNGIHLCGVTDDEEQPTTAALYEMSAEEARGAFAIAKGVAECGKDEADFVVDLCIDGSIEDDFWSNRQLWSLAIRAWNAAIATEARRAETSSGSVHEGAGLQGIAQPQSVSGLSHTGVDRG